MTSDQLLNTVAAMTPETYTPNQKEFVLAVAKLFYQAGVVDGKQSCLDAMDEEARKPINVLIAG